MDNIFSSYLQRLQTCLPGFEFNEVLGPMTSQHERVIVTLDIVQIEHWVPFSAIPSGRGRPRADRTALARAFIAKPVLILPTTEALIDRLRVDRVLRRVCGWERCAEIPCIATFSNAFAEFAKAGIPEKVHAKLVTDRHSDVPVHNVSRDATAIPAWEKPQAKVQEKIPQKKPMPRGWRRRRKPEEVPPSPLEKQQGQTLESMIADLPKACDVGTKKNSKGYRDTWIGYKLHIDCVNGGVPVSLILTSASVHDSRVSLPLEAMTAERVIAYYTLADAAYDARIIHEDIASRGKVPVIDHNPRTGEKIPFDGPKSRRYSDRTSVERVNADLKDNYGGRFVRVRGATKVMCHLMFGVLALTAQRLLDLGSFG